MRIYFWWCERDVVKKLDAPEEHLGISGSLGEVKYTPILKGSNSTPFGLWEALHNPNFNPTEFGGGRNRLA